MSAIQNFQIPVTDFKRAHDFYNFVMDYNLETLEYQGAQLAFFQCKTENGISGSLIKSEGLNPSREGTMVYLQAGNDLQPYVERVMNAGGLIFMEKTPLGPDMGFFAIFDDCEGNRVGLYSNN